MRVATLVSGGLDSTVMAALMRDEGIEQAPLFIQYGQLNVALEKAACFRNLNKLGIPRPAVIDLAGYGAAFPSGLTDPNLRIKEDAFLPGRNLLFLLCAAAHAVREDCEAIAIGLLDESLSLFPDQTKAFIGEAESLLKRIIHPQLRIITPLMSMNKAEVLAVAKALGVSGTYSCHAGTEKPCGVCIACLEFTGLEV